MSFLAPLGLALGALIPVLILFYLLKVRRQEYEVGSTYLWQDLLRDLAAHEPWQRFHWSVLLALQLLLVGVLVFAVARPFYVAQAEEVVHAVVVLDGGASMQATDVEPTRFEVAKRQARETVRNLADGSFGTVILAADQPRVLAPSTTDRSALDRAIEAAQVTYTAADVGRNARPARRASVASERLVARQRAAPARPAARRISRAGAHGHGQDTGGP